MAIAEHHPEEVYARNKGVLGMNHQQLHEFADTKESSLPEHVGLRKAVRKHLRHG